MSVHYSIVDDNAATRLAAAVLEQAIEDARLLVEMAARRAWRNTTRQQAMRAAAWFVATHAELEAFLRSGRFGWLMEGMRVDEYHFIRALERELARSAPMVPDAKEVMQWANRQGRKSRKSQTQGAP